MWSGLGAYPETPGSATVRASARRSSPNTAIHLGNGKTITETAPQAADNAALCPEHDRQRVQAYEQRVPAGRVCSPDGGTVNWTLGHDARTRRSRQLPRVPAPPSDDVRVCCPRSATSAVRRRLARCRSCNPGDSTTLTLGVQSMHDRSRPGGQLDRDGDLGLRDSQVGPTSGSINGQCAEKQATQQVAVTVPSVDRRTATIRSPFHLSTRRPAPRCRTSSRTSASPRPGDMTPYYNDVGHLVRQRPVGPPTSTATASATPSRRSPRRASRSERPVTVGRREVHVPVRGSRHARTASPRAGRQSALLQPSGESKIGILGTATNGPSTGVDDDQLHRRDQSQQVTLAFSDWTLNAGSSSAVGRRHEQVAADVRIATRPAAASQTVGTYLFNARASRSRPARPWSERDPALDDGHGLAARVRDRVRRGPADPVGEVHRSGPAVVVSTARPDGGSTRGAGTGQRMADVARRWAADAEVWRTPVSASLDVRSFRDPPLPRPYRARRTRRGRRPAPAVRDQDRLPPTALARADGDPRRARGDLAAVAPRRPSAALSWSWTSWSPSAFRACTSRSGSGS